MKKILITGSFAMLLASAYGVTAQTNFYLQGFMGGSDPAAPTPAQVNATSSDTRGFVFGGTLGFEYAVNANFLTGIEVSELSFGSSSYVSGTGTDSTTVQNFSSEGTQILGTLTYLNQNGVNVFGKLGVIDEETDFWSMTSATWFPLFANISSVSAWLPVAAVGVGFMPSNNWNISLQYEHTFGSDWNVSNPTNSLNPMTENAFTLGVTYKIPV